MGKKRIREFQKSEKFKCLLFTGYKDLDVVQKLLFDTDFSVEFKNNGEEFVKITDNLKLEKGQYLCRSLKTGEIFSYGKDEFDDLFN